MCTSHHPWACITLTPFHCDNVQCRMHHHLHKDWVHNCVSWSNHSMQPYMHTTGLWMIPLTPWSPTAPTALPAINLTSIAMATNVNTTSSSAKYACYVHQLLCSPPAATLLHTLATSTKLTTIPGLTPTLIHSFLPHSTATDKGHMRRHCSCNASTCNNHANLVLTWA